MRVSAQSRSVAAIGCHLLNSVATKMVALGLAGSLQGDITSLPMLSNQQFQQ